MTEVEGLSPNLHGEQCDDISSKRELEANWKYISRRISK